MITTAFTMASDVAMSLAWFVAGWTLYQAAQHPSLRWIALWITLLAVSSTMNFIAPPLSLAQYVAFATETVAIVGLTLSIRRLRRAHRHAGRHEVEASLERLISHATAFPANEHTADAKKAVLEGIGNAIDFLVTRHLNEDYPMQGPGGRVFTWRWQRSEDTDAISENLVTLTQITYTMLFLASAQVLGHPTAPDMEFRIEQQAMASLMAFIVYQQPVSDLLVAPLPYRQSEYRSALKAAWDAIVLPNLIKV